MVRGAERRICTIFLRELEVERLDEMIVRRDSLEPLGVERQKRGARMEVCLRAIARDDDEEAGRKAGLGVRSGRALSPRHSFSLAERPLLHRM